MNDKVIINVKGISGSKTIDVTNWSYIDVVKIISFYNDIKGFEAYFKIY